MMLAGTLVYIAPDNITVSGFVLEKPETLFQYFLSDHPFSVETTTVQLIL